MTIRDIIIKYSKELEHISDTPKIRCRNFITKSSWRCG